MSLIPTATATKSPPGQLPPYAQQDAAADPINNELQRPKEILFRAAIFFFTIFETELKVLRPISCNFIH